MAGGVLEFPVAAVLIEHTGVAGVDGGEEEVEVAADDTGGASEGSPTVFTGGNITLAAPAVSGETLTGSLETTIDDGSNLSGTFNACWCEPMVDLMSWDVGGSDSGSPAGPGR